MIVGENGAAGERWMNLRDYHVVSPAYLRTMGVPVVRGRDFAEGDRGQGEGVAIVDEASARRLWPEFASPVGRMLKLGGPDADAPWLRVVGVVPALAKGPGDEHPDPRIYVVFARDTMKQRDILVRAATGADTRELEITVRRTLRALAPAQSYVTVGRYLAWHERQVGFLTFLATLYCALGAFSLVLCAAGLYGVLAYQVSVRQREFAIRKALGAPEASVARAVLHDAAVTALAGIGVGAFIALAATRGVVDGMTPIPLAEAKALVAAEAVLLLVAAAAAWEPVRRAMRADPARVMQAQ